MFISALTAGNKNIIAQTFGPGEFTLEIPLEGGELPEKAKQLLQRVRIDHLKQHLFIDYIRANGGGESAQLTKEKPGEVR